MTVDRCRPYHLSDEDWTLTLGAAKAAIEWGSATFQWNPLNDNDAAMVRCCQNVPAK